MTPVQQETRYLIDEDDNVVSVDGDWFSFASENNALELAQRSIVGESIWDFISGLETSHLYELIFAEVRREGREVTVPFRCDSPTKRRFMSLNINCLPDRKLSITSSLVKEESRPYVAVLDVIQVDPNWFVTICSWCKRIRLEEDQWVDVEVAVEKLQLFEVDCQPSLSHGMCPDCADALCAELPFLNEVNPLGSDEIR